MFSVKGSIGSLPVETYDRNDENINMIKDSVILVFIENEAEKNDLYKEIEKVGCVCNFERQKPIDLAKRIKTICNAYKVNIDNSTLNYFIEVCGTSLQDLINEIRKQIEAQKATREKSFLTYHIL